jgi:RHS repeat-associated protein
MYDAAGRLIKLVTPTRKAIQWQYDLNKQRIQQTIGNHAWTRYSYNNRGELSRLTNYTPKGRQLSTFSNISYEVGNTTQVNAVFPGIPSFSGVTTYEYDSKGELIQEHSSRNGGYTHNYSYDSSGNAIFFNDQYHPDYNSNNQPVEAGYSFDGNGNPILYKNNCLLFDPDNHLTEFKDNNDAIKLKAGYNGLGLRIWKENDNGRIYFLYDGTDLLAELDQNGTIKTINIFGATGLLSRNDTWYQYDIAGNVIHRSDNNGKVIYTDLKDAWGNNLVTSSSTDPFGYNAQWGYYTDVETGLILCTYRYYDPSSGRFLTRDPIGYVDGPNLYTYVGNNVVNQQDPLGTSVNWYCVKVALKHPGVWATAGAACTITLMDGMSAGCLACIGASALSLGITLPACAPVCGATITKCVATALIAGSAAFIWAYHDCNTACSSNGN